MAANLVFHSGLLLGALHRIFRPVTSPNQKAPLLSDKDPFQFCGNAFHKNEQVTLTSIILASARFESDEHQEPQATDQALG